MKEKAHKVTANIVSKMLLNIIIFFVLIKTILQHSYTCSSVLFFTVSLSKCLLQAQGHIYYTEETVSHRKSQIAPTKPILNVQIFVVLYLKKLGICKLWSETCLVWFISHRLHQINDRDSTVSTTAMCENDTVKIGPSSHILNVLIWVRGNMYRFK